MSDSQFLGLAGVFILAVVSIIFFLWLGGFFDPSSPYILKSKPKDDAKRTFEKPPADTFNPYWIEEYRRNHPEDQE